jgi:hypothetical protein
VYRHAAPARPWGQARGTRMAQAQAAVMAATRGATPWFDCAGGILNH